MSEKKPEPSQFAEAAKLIDAFKASLNGYEKFIGAFTKSVHDSVIKPPTPEPRFKVGQIVWHIRSKEYVTVTARGGQAFGKETIYSIKTKNGDIHGCHENLLEESEPYEIQVGDKVLMDQPKRGCWFRNEEAEVVRTHVPGLLGVKILRTNKTYWVRDYAANLVEDVKPAPEVKKYWFPDHSDIPQSKKRTTTTAEASKGFETGQTYYFVSDNPPFWRAGDPCTFIGTLTTGQIEVSHDGAIFRVLRDRITASDPKTTPSIPEVFKVGDVVYITEDCPGFKAGDSGTVVDFDPKGNCRVRTTSFSAPVSPLRLTKTPPTPETFEPGIEAYLNQAFKGIPLGSQVKILRRNVDGSYLCWYGTGFKEVHLPPTVLTKVLPQNPSQWIPPEWFDPQEEKGACYGFSSASTNDFGSSAVEAAKMAAEAFKAYSQSVPLPKKRRDFETPFYSLPASKLPAETSWPTNEATQFKLYDLVNLVNATGFPYSTETVFKIELIDRKTQKVRLSYKGTNCIETTVSNIRRVR